MCVCVLYLGPKVLHCLSTVRHHLIVNDARQELMVLLLPLYSDVVHPFRDPPISAYHVYIKACAACSSDMRPCTDSDHKQAER